MLSGTFQRRLAGPARPARRNATVFSHRAAPSPRVRRCLLSRAAAEVRAHCMQAVRALALPARRAHRLGDSSGMPWTSLMPGSACRSPTRRTRRRVAAAAAAALPTPPAGRGGHRHGGRQVRRRGGAALALAPASRLRAQRVARPAPPPTTAALGTPSPAATWTTALRPWCPPWTARAQPSRPRSSTGPHWCEGRGAPRQRGSGSGLFAGDRPPRPHPTAAGLAAAPLNPRRLAAPPRAGGCPGGPGG